MIVHDLVLDKGDVVFDANEPISGKVILTLTQPKDVTSVEVVLIGLIEIEIPAGEESFKYDNKFLK